MINSELMKAGNKYPGLADNYMHLMLSQSRDCIYIYEISSRRMVWLGGRKELFTDTDIAGNAPDNLLKRGYVHAENKEAFLNLFACMEGKAPAGSCAVQLRPITKQDYHWVKISYTVFSGSCTGCEYALLIFSDVTAKLTAEKQYFYEDQLRAMLSEDVIAVSKVNLTQDRVEYIWRANTDTEQLKQVQTYEQMYQVGLQGICDEEGRKKYEQTFGYPALLHSVEKGQNRIVMEYQRWEQQKKAVRWALMSAALTRDAQSGDLYYYSFIRDIDEKKRTELMLRKKAERDSLTGLYNKETAELMIREGLGHNQEHGGLCALMVMDIDNFKNINDTYGHPYGDYVLSQVGSILANVFAAGAIKGRFGGDEFVVFKDGISSMEWAFEKSRQLQAVLGQAFSSVDGGIRLTLSIGITFSEGGGAFEELYEQADRALYEAKLNGKNQYIVFQHQLHKHAVPIGRGMLISGRCINEVCIMEELEELAVVVDMERYQILYANAAARKALELSDTLSDCHKCHDLIYGFSEPCRFCQKDGACGEPFNIWINDIGRLGKRFIIKEKPIMWGRRKARLEILFDAEQLKQHYR